MLRARRSSDWPRRPWIGHTQRDFEFGSAGVERVTERLLDRAQAVSNRPLVDAEHRGRRRRVVAGGEVRPQRLTQAGVTAARARELAEEGPHEGGPSGLVIEHRCE